MLTGDQSNASTCTPAVFSVNSSSCYVFPSYFIAVSLSINLAFGFPANVYILWLSVTEMFHRRVTDIFIFNAALVEVVYNVSFIFLIRQYFFNCTTCRFGVFFPGMILVFGRPMFQSCTCVDRYLAVLHPVTFLKLKPMKYRVSFSIMAWVVILISSLSVTVNIIELHQLAFPELLVFFSIKAFTCLMVLKALKRSGPGDGSKLNQDKLKAFHTIRIVLVSAVVMYGPIITSLLLYNLIDLQRFLLSWSIALSVAVISGFTQPFLYLSRAGKLPFSTKAS